MRRLSPQSGPVATDVPAGPLDRMLADLVVVACRTAIAPLASEVATLRRVLEDRMPVAFVSRAQAAQQLSVSTDTVDKMCRDGRLISRRMGRAVRIDPRSLFPQSDTEIAILASTARGER